MLWTLTQGRLSWLPPTGRPQITLELSLGQRRVNRRTLLLPLYGSFGQRCPSPFQTQESADADLIYCPWYTTGVSVARPRWPSDNGGCAMQGAEGGD